MLDSIKRANQVFTSSIHSAAQTALSFTASTLFAAGKVEGEKHSKASSIIKNERIVKNFFIRTPTDICSFGINIAITSQAGLFIGACMGETYLASLPAGIVGAMVGYIVNNAASKFLVYYEVPESHLSDIIMKSVFIASGMCSAGIYAVAPKFKPLRDRMRTQITVGKRNKRQEKNQTIGVQASTKANHNVSTCSSPCAIKIRRQVVESNPSRILRC